MRANVTGFKRNIDKGAISSIDTEQPRVVDNFTRSAPDETCHIESLLKLESFNLETDRLRSR